MSQADKLLQLLSDGLPARTDRIMREVYGSEHLGIARIGARIADLKKKGYTIRGWKDPEKSSLYWYQMETKKKIEGYEEAAKKIIENPKFGDREFLDILKDITEIHRAKRKTEELERKKQKVIWYANMKLK